MKQRVFKYGIGDKFELFNTSLEILNLAYVNPTDKGPTYTVKFDGRRISFIEEQFIDGFLLARNAVADMVSAGLSCCCGAVLDSTCEPTTNSEANKDADSDNPLDEQVGGDHYKCFAVPPVEFIERNKLGFSVGNCIKYLCRYKDKNGREDLEKAKHYIDLLIQMEYPDNEKD